MRKIIILVVLLLNGCGAINPFPRDLTLFQWAKGLLVLPVIAPVAAAVTTTCAGPCTTATIHKAAMSAAAASFAASGITSPKQSAVLRRAYCAIAALELAQACAIQPTDLAGSACHFYVSGAAAAKVYDATGSVTLALGGSALVGVAKELFDVGRTGFDLRDLVDDAQGALAPFRFEGLR